MEVIKKQMQRIMTTGSTTGCTDCFVFVPDLLVNYSFKILLSTRDIDFGFFDALIPTYGYIEPYYGYGSINNVSLEPIGLGNLI